MRVSIPEITVLDVVEPLSCGGALSSVDAGPSSRANSYAVAVNRICELFGVNIPIIQAPMTYLATAKLAAAVSEAGGLGVIETASPEGRADVARVRELTQRPVAANIALRMWPDLDGVLGVIDLLVSSGIRAVTTSAGNPRTFTERLHEVGITVAHVVGSLDTARKAVDAGVDALIVEGIEGGGFKRPDGASTMVLLPLVAASFDLPIIAAGGICDGASMAAAMALGADGVQMGTRFLLAAESPAHPGFTDAVLAANESATHLVPLTRTTSMRVLATDASRRLASGEAPGAGGLGGVQRLYFHGEMDASVANLGQVAGRIGSVEPAAAIVRDTWRGCRAALDAARARMGSPAS